MGKSSFWATYQCDRCGKVDHPPKHDSAPKRLPPAWISHHYTGETLCAECAEKDGKP